MNSQKLKQAFGLCRDIYTVLYISFFAILFFIPVQNALGNITTFLYLAIAGLGAALLFAAVFLNRSAFLKGPNLILSLFAVASLISTAVNFRYEPVSNIKEICWMCIMFFLIQAVDDSCPREKLTRLFRLVSNIFIVIWFVGVFVSFCQFVAGYGAWISTPYNDNDVHRVGFVEGRLFGVFGDPNYAAIGSFFAIVLSVYNMTERALGKLVRACYIVSMVFEYFYIILSGSRAALISTAVAVFFIAFFLTLKYKAVRDKSTVVRVLLSVASAAVSAALLVIISNLIKEILIYLPTLYSEICNALGLRVKQNSVANLHRPDLEEDSDISNNRFKIWIDSIAVWKTSPVVGATPRGYLKYAMENLGDLYIVKRGYIIHNAYLSVLLFTGIIGALLVIAFIVYAAYLVLRFLFKSNSKSCSDYNRVLILSAVIVAEAVSSVALSQMFFSHMVTDALFWMTVGYTFYFIRQSETATACSVVAEKQSGQTDPDPSQA